MQKIRFTNLSLDAQKTAIMDALRSTWYLDSVLGSIELDVHDSVCEHFELLFHTVKVEPMFGTSCWSLDGLFIIPSVKVRLQITDEDELKDFVCHQLRNCVQFSFDERDVVGVDAISVDGFSAARIESTTRMKEMDRVALEDVVAILARAIERYSSGHVKEKAKVYFSDEAIRLYLEELNMEYTEDGRLIYEVDSPNG